MRSLAGVRTKTASWIGALAITAGLALATATGARAACAYPPLPFPAFPASNIFAGGGSCSVDTSAGSVTVQAQFLPPNVFGSPIFPGFGYAGFAVSAYSGGTINVTGANLLNILSYADPTTTDPYPGAPTNPYGVLSIGESSLVSFAGPTSVTTGYAGSPGSLTPAPTDMAIGLYAKAGGTITASGTMTVTTNGTGASGVDADASAFGAPDSQNYIPAAASEVQLSGGGSVTTIGANSAGLLATGDVTGGNQATITADGFTITTGTQESPQPNSPGAEADPLGLITLNGASTITTYGSGSVGLLAIGEALGSETTATGGSIVVNGALTLKTNDATTPAVELEGVGASIQATGGGTISSAYRAIEFLNGSGQTGTFNGFTSITGSGDLIVADGSTSATLNFTSTTANAGANNLLNVTDGSSLTFNAASSTLTGAIQTESGSGEIPASTTTVNLTNGSTWNVTGSSVVSNLSITNSSVVFAGPTEGGGFKTITVGSYTGSGASVTMNVALVGTGTPSGQLGDQIIVSGGKATGSTNVVIVNTTPISLGQSINKLIPLFVTTNGGTIGPGASFILAGVQNASGYAFSLEETATGVDLVATQTTSQSQLGSSVNSVAASQQKALITSQVLTSVLLGATEQVNCSNCGSGFGSIGSYAIGAHGRTSLTPELTLMGGFSYDEYSAPGITVTNAPTFAGSLVYDPTNFGQSRPFLEVGGGVIPFEQVHYTRIYPYAGEVALGYGNAIDRSLGLFARVGWVDRVTPNDEAAVYTDISRSWLQAGGYGEAPIGANPIPATVSTGLEALDVARVGAQWTHLFANQFEVNVGAALAYGFDAVNTQQWAFTGYSPIAPYPISNSAWCEWGARAGYRLGNRMVIDAFAVGTLGGQIGATIHGGLGMRYLF